MRIRSRLLLLVSAVLAPALVAAGIGLAYLYDEERKFHYASIAETARALALALDRDMGRREAMLRTLAASLAHYRGDLRSFHDHALAVARATDTAIILSDLDGQQLVNTRLPFGAKLPRMRPEEREMRTRFGDELTLISNVHVPPAGLGPHSFAIQVPVRHEGKAFAFLSMGSFTAQMQQLLLEQSLPQGWHATVVDRKGIVAARSLEPERFVGQPVRASLKAQLETQTEGFSEGLSLGGAPGTVFFSRAPESGWSFLLTVPRAALDGPARRATVLMAAVSLVLLGLGLAAALAVARHVSWPVESLREAAERLGRGEPVQPPRSGIDEIDAVGRAMAGAGERLRESTAVLERRVAQAVAGFEQSQRALLQAQKLEALGRLTGGIAHDFNNVLQTLTTGLQVLKRGVPDGRHELFASCERAVARGSELARQLMAFGRVQEVRVETIDTAARLAEARQLLVGALPANIALAWEFAPGLWPVAVDPAQLELALLNLVINARDAMPRGGRVVLRGANEVIAGEGAEVPAGDYVVLTVADTGEGMSEEVKARALDPFYTTKGVGKGSGMGLPQAYGFARQCGGALTLESRPGEGTTVRLYLPRARSPLAGPAPRAEAGTPVGAGTVLLVEDEAHVRNTVAAALRTAGFDVQTAATADEALARLDGGETYDAVLTDVVMPGRLSGVDLAGHLRRRYPRTGVVLATGYSDHAVQLPGVRALPKPYELEQVVEALSAAMKGSAL